MRSWTKGCVSGLLATALAAVPAFAQATELIEAVRSRDVAAVRSLIGQQVDVDAAQGDGATALHWAAHLNDVDTAGLLIDAGARVNAANDYGATPLWLAAQNGSLPMVERLLAAKADPNVAFPSGETPLMTAAQGGRADVVKALLDGGAQVDAIESNMGQTALMWAVAEGHDDVVRVLVDHGASVTATSTSGFTPYLFAARAGDIPTAQYLASRGADPKGTTEDGTTALHVAVVRGHLPFAKYLLGLGLDPNASGPGYTVLHWAVGTWESIFTHEYLFSPDASTQEKEWSVLGGVPGFEAKVDLIKTLLAAGADINARVQRPPPRFGGSIFPANYLVGGTPFFVATVAADVPVMKLLLSAGADPMVGAKDGTTPLIAAAGIARVDSETVIPEERLLEAMQICLDLGHEVNAANTAGNTAMHAAALQGLDSVAKFLYDHGAEVNPRNEKGETPYKITLGYQSAGMVYLRPSTAAVLKALGGVVE
ncbi:MAG: hypothetical protein FJW23_00745 [Acidimicrobiia bacterium]|nr:hypothetical protein [Acidimicrobiia bacterium]